MMYVSSQLSIFDYLRRRRSASPSVSVCTAAERFRMRQPLHLCVTCVTRLPEKPEIQGKNASPLFQRHEFQCVTKRHHVSPNGSAMRNVSSFLFLFVPECCHYMLYRKKSSHSSHSSPASPKSPKNKAKTGLFKKFQRALKSSQHVTTCHQTAAEGSVDAILKRSGLCGRANGKTSAISGQNRIRDRMRQVVISGHPEEPVSPGGSGEKNLRSSACICGSQVWFLVCGFLFLV